MDTIGQSEIILSDCRIGLYSITGYTATQIPFFSEAPETGFSSE